MPKKQPAHAPLTKAEEEIMQSLWQFEQATVNEVIGKMSKSGSHYNTVSTLLKILVEKGFAASQMLGNVYYYRALIAKEDYRKGSARQLLSRYFDGSLANLISSFAGERELDVESLESILKAIKKQKK